MTSSYNVFLSYSREDASRVERLQKILQTRPDVRLFSADDLSAGEKWEKKLRAAIHKSNVFVLILSPSAIASPWVLQELGAAWLLKKRIILVQVDAKYPTRLPIALGHVRTVNRKDLRQPKDFDPWFKQLGEHQKTAK